MIVDFEQSESCIEVGCGTVITQVKDSGIGVAENVKKHLFHLFGTIQTKFEGILTTQGIGVGLTICKSLVEHMKGTISLESEEKKGTKVIFEIPF